MGKVKMNYIVLVVLAFLIAFSAVFIPQTSLFAQADMGPKPQIYISFENMGDEVCYVTLLSSEKNAGPHNVYDGDPEHLMEYEDALEQEAYDAFIAYEDKDGFYYQQFHQKCNETKQFRWGYYPPDTFKILLYYPETDSIIVGTEILERYAFTSYYTVDMNTVTVTDVRGEDKPQNEVDLGVEESYNYVKEAIFFLIRLVVTIIIEFLIALMFRFPKGAVRIAVIITNVLTQLLLNFVLWSLSYMGGPVAGFLIYIPLEIAIIIIEAIVYAFVLKRKSDKRSPKLTAFIYSLVANLLSFALGSILLLLEVVW